MYWQEDFWHFCDTKIVSAICGRYMWLGLPRQINNCLKGVEDIKWRLNPPTHPAVPTLFRPICGTKFLLSEWRSSMLQNNSRVYRIIAGGSGTQTSAGPPILSLVSTQIRDIDYWYSKSVRPSVRLSVCLPILSFTFRVFVETTRHCHGFSTAR